MRKNYPAFLTGSFHMTNRRTAFHYKKIIFTACIFLGMNYMGAQSPEEILTKSFDQIIGKENLDINNGTFHTNEFRVINNKHRYYPSEKFEKGDVTYNNQQYFDIDIKYDLYKDILVYRPQDSDFLSINLISEKISTFKLNNKNFVYLNSLNFPLNDVKSGLYEKCVNGKTFIFYIKHKRDKREVFKETTAFNEFENNYEYYLEKNGALYKINAKKDLVKLFPDFKRQINDFYSAFKPLEKENKPLFYEKLMIYLNNATENNLN